MNSNRYPYLLAVILSLLLGALGPLSRDGDLYFHLRFGDEILKQRSLPRVDTFTYTASGAPSELHSWLGSAVLAATYKLGGETGLRFLEILIVFLLLFLVARYGEREKLGTFWSSVAIGAVFLVYAEVADLRPFAFAAIFLMWGALALPEKKIGVLLWALLWANFHGSSLIAPLVVFVFARRERWIHSGLALFAVFCTPQGFRAYLSAFQLSKLAMTYQVSEWMPPRLVGWSEGTLELYLSAAFFAVSVGALFVGLRRAPKRERLFALGAMVLYFASRRHIVFLLPVLPWVAREFSANTGIRSLVWEPLSQSLVFLLVIFLHGIRWPMTVPMPIEAVDFLKNAGVRGNILAHQIWGGYVAWRMPDDAKVGIDCRITVHQAMARLFAQKVRADGTVDLAKVTLALPETDLLLFPSETALRSLFQRTGTVVYESPVATVVLLNTERNTENRLKIEHYYRDRSIPFSFREGFDAGLVVETRWWNEQNRYRYPHWDAVGRAGEIVAEIDFYRIRGLSRRALQVAKRAVDNGSQEPPILFRLGELLLENGDIASSRRWLTFLEEKFGREATLPLHRALVRVDPLALR